jgi:SAM-dependent methyltransferase
MNHEPHRSAFDQSTRRRKPRIMDSDWLVLRGLAAEVTRAADGLARQGATAIDVGCGDQPYRLLFEERGVTYQGADFGTAAEISIAADGSVAAPDGAADLVLSFQVLEHVRDLDTYLAEIKRLLRPGGRLLLSTHGMWLYHPHPEDHRRWTREGLVNELQSRGFAIESCRPVVGPLALTTIMRLTAFAYALRRIPLLGPAMLVPLAIVMNARAVIEDWITPAAVRNDNACVYLVQASVVE